MPTPITLTETYIDAAGNPVGAGSRVLFLLTVPLTDSTTGARVPATTLTAPLDNQGRLLDPDTLQPGVILFATDDPTTLPTGAAYRVEERIAGQETRIYYITVPYNAPSGTIALGLLVPGDTAPPVTYALQSVQMPAPFSVTRQAGIDVVTYDLTGRSVGDVSTILSLAPDVVGFAPPPGGGAALADTDPLPLADPADPGTAEAASRADHVHPRDGGMRWRGEWDAATAYAAGDGVLFVLEGEDLAASFVAGQAATGADQDPNHDDYWTYFAYAVLPTVADGISVAVPNTQYLRLNGGTLIDNGGGQAEYTPTVPALSDDPSAPLGTADPGTADTTSRGDHAHALPTLGDLGAASAADLTTEISNRAGADTTLAGLITAEASTRASAITSEATTRAANDTTNANALAAEAVTARAAESANATAIATETTNRGTAVTAEATTRATADTTNATAIATETTNRTNADSTHAAQTGASAHSGLALTTHTHAESEVSSLAADLTARALAVLFPLATGYWYAATNPTQTTAILTNGTVYGCLWVVSRACTIDQLAVEVTVVGSAGSVIRLGIYNTVAGLPSGLVLDAGTVSGTSVAVAAITGLSTVLTPGLYWLAACNQGTPTTGPTCRLNSGIVAGIGGQNTGISGNNPSGYIMATGVTSGALPSTISSPTWTTSGHRVLAHISA